MVIIRSALHNNVEAILSGKGNDGEETAVGCTKRSVKGCGVSLPADVGRRNSSMMNIDSPRPLVAPCRIMKDC